MFRATPLARLNPKLLTILLAVITVIVAHGMFSSFGFNPTDDGYHLAGARRILDGQIPHRDFITIRPAGSFYLHAPFVLLGGPYILMASRLFVWVQFVLIIWSWIYIINHYLELKLWENTNRVFLAWAWSVVGLIFSVHSFPLMAWHTIDGLFFGSIGLALLLTSNWRTKSLGYLLVGCTPLFKQNFLALPPLVWLLTQQWQNRRSFLNSLLMAIPVLGYLGLLSAVGAGTALESQLNTHTELSFNAYLKLSNWLQFTGLGFTLALLWFHPKKVWRWISLPIIAIFIYQLRDSFQAVIKFLHIHSYYLFHLIVGVAIYSLATYKSHIRLFQLTTLALSFAWIASVSIGYSSPALATGALIMIVLALMYAQVKNDQWLLFYYGFGLVILVFLTFKSFVWMRTMGVYRDLPAIQLKSDLGQEFRGANGVLSNTYTEVWLNDLNQTIKHLAGRPYALAPDFPAYWMSSDQRNPLSIDWPQSTELATQTLQSRIEQDLIRLRTQGGVVLIQKDDVSRLPNGFYPLPLNQYFIVEYVQHNWNLATESAHFLVYQ